MSKQSLRHGGFAAFGVVMVVATITLVGLVAFQFLEAQDNTEVANNQQRNSPKVAQIETKEDIDTATRQLESVELDALDAELDAAFDF